MIYTPYVCLLRRSVFDILLQTTLESVMSSMENREGKIRRLEAKFSAVEDEVFGRFCRDVGLENIRYVWRYETHSYVRTCN